MSRRTGAAAVALWACLPGMAETAGSEALFAAGCFWCVEAALADLEGVVEIEVGYVYAPPAPPAAPERRAEGRARYETVRVRYDPDRTSYRRLLIRFLLAIDPTDPDGQFCERGPEKRTAVFFADDAERAEAERLLAAAGRALGAPIATVALPAAPFKPAAAHHQDYARRNPLRFDFWVRACGRDAGLRALWSGARFLALEADR